MNSSVFHCAFSPSLNIPDLQISPHAVHRRHRTLVCRTSARCIGILANSLQGYCTWPIHWYMKPESAELLHIGGWELCLLLASSETGLPWHFQCACVFGNHSQLCVVSRMPHCLSGEMNARRHSFMIIWALLFNIDREGSILIVSS